MMNRTELLRRRRLLHRRIQDVLAERRLAVATANGGAAQASAPEQAGERAE
jgi:hypothetical protein